MCPTPGWLAMALGDITREAVLKAIEEYDALGQPAFLHRYGFDRARQYSAGPRWQALRLEGESSASRTASCQARPAPGPPTSSAAARATVGHSFWLDSASRLRTGPKNLSDTLVRQLAEAAGVPPATAIAAALPADRAALGFRSARAVARRGSSHWAETKRQVDSCSGRLRPGPDERDRRPLPDRRALRRGPVGTRTSRSGDRCRPRTAAQSPHRWFENQQPRGGLVDPVYTPDQGVTRWH